MDTGTIYPMTLTQTIGLGLFIVLLAKTPRENTLVRNKFIRIAARKSKAERTARR